ncbi:uncharacterized protein LOC144603140 [Rhinoraja longicauda]
MLESVRRSEDMTGMLIQCDACRMWEVRDTAGASGRYNCGKCVPVQLLKDHVGALERQLDGLRIIREREAFPEQDLQRDRYTEDAGREKVGVDEEGKEAWRPQGFAHLEAIGTEGTASLSGGQVCESKHVMEAQLKRQMSGKAMVVEDSIVRYRQGFLRQQAGFKDGVLPPWCQDPGRTSWTDCRASSRVKMSNRKW